MARRKCSTIRISYLEFFLPKFSASTEVVATTAEQVESYRGILPDRLLEYWQHLDFSGFRDGLFWITNPAEFEDVLDVFLGGTDFADYDNYHVIARSAYGELYMWGKETSRQDDEGKFACLLAGHS